MSCPNCDSDNLDILDGGHFSPDHHIERYICNECNTIFVWESTRSIEEEGKEEIFNKQLKELLQRNKEAIEEEEEE